MRRPGLACGRALAVLVCLLAANLCPAAERVVAVGDIHGAYDEFVSVLRTAEVIDKDLAWTGGNTILIQTGDVVDRGPHSRAAMDLLMDLAEKAARQGGEVRPLMGNHESMILMGDLRYVSPEDYRSFASSDSENTRQAEFENYVKYRKKRASRLEMLGPAFGDAEKQAWLDAHPPGYFEFRQALAPGGKYGRWIRTHDTATQVGDVLFVHGGLSPQSPLKNIKEVNEKGRKEVGQMDELWARLSSRGILWPYLSFEEAQAEAKTEWAAQRATGTTDSELQSFLSLRDWNIISPQGPLWYRGYAQQPETEFASQLEKVLKRFKVRCMVMGHSVPATKRITVRFDGRVFLIDTGMLAGYFQGRPSALEINGGHFRAIYVGEPAQALAGSGAAQGN